MTDNKLIICLIIEVVTGKPCAHATYASNSSAMEPQFKLYVNIILISIRQLLFTKMQGNCSILFYRNT